MTITTSSQPAGRCTVFEKDGSWWLKQWHEIRPGAQFGLKQNVFDTKKEAEAQADALVASGKYVRR
jgi:hypothetical protein